LAKKSKALVPTEGATLAVPQLSLDEVVAIAKAQLEAKVAPLKNATESLVAGADVLLVESPGDKAAAIEYIKAVKAQQDIIEATRTHITKPLDAAKGAAQAVFNPLKEQVVAAIATAKAKLIEYDDKQEREKAEAAEALAKKVESGRLKPETAERRLALMQDPEKTTQAEGASGTTTRRRVVVITNAELVPDEFWVIDEAKLEKATLAADDARAPLPPGVAITKVKGVTIK
jgi:hypothetical protein